jgi:hypothetical protein
MLLQVQLSAVQFHKYCTRASGMVSLLIYYQSFGIKQPCSDLILQIPTRLLGNQHIFESHHRMAYVVRLIPVAPILLSTGVLGLRFYPLKVRENSKATAGIQSLNGP